MNHIRQLQQHVADLNAQREAVAETVQQMLEYLHGPKFTGIEQDGSRRDWISTGDVIGWLREVRSQLIDPRSKF